MPPFERRMQRYAVLTASGSALVVLLLAGVLPDRVAAVAILLAALPVILAWGPYQAHLALNANLDEVERSRWRIAFYLLWPSMAIYWVHHVRAQSLVD
ncbi:MAG: hypothetical protein ACJ762_18500 [Solirubrobacteraceae bacterium]